MNGLATLTLVALALGGTAASASTDMAAGSPGQQPCHVYLHRDLPAPKRCFRYFQDAVGPGVYVHGGFVFRNREAFLHPRGRAAARSEERWAYRDKGRYGDRDEDRYREREDTSREGPSPNEDREGVSGGASRGRGAYQGESGDASRGASARDNRSGGASGY